MSDNRIEKIPTHLKHKPIYGIENYSEIDGQYKNNTDAVGLSLGKAQWSDAGFCPRCQGLEAAQWQMVTARVRRLPSRAY